MTQKTFIIQSLSTEELSEVGATLQRRTEWMVLNKPSSPDTVAMADIVESYIESTANDDSFLYKYILKKSVPVGNTYYWFYRRIFTNAEGNEFIDPVGWQGPAPINSTAWDLFSNVIRSPLVLRKPLLVSIDLEMLYDTTSRYFTMNISKISPDKEGHLSTSWVIMDSSNDKVIFSELKSTKLISYKFDKQAFDIDDILTVDVIKIVAIQHTETMDTPLLIHEVVMSNIGITLVSNISGLNSRYNKIVKFGVRSGSSIKKVSLIDPNTSMFVKTYIEENIAGDAIDISADILQQNRILIVRVYHTDTLFIDFKLSTTIGEQLFIVNKDLKYNNQLEFIGSTLAINTTETITEGLIDERVIIFDRDKFNFFSVKFKEDGTGYSGLRMINMFTKEEKLNITRVSKIFNITNNSFVVEFLRNDNIIVLQFVKYSANTFSFKNKLERSNENLGVTCHPSKITRGPGDQFVYFISDTNQGRSILKWDVNSKNSELVYDLKDPTLSTGPLTIAMVDRDELLIINSNSSIDGTGPVYRLDTNTKIITVVGYINYNLHVDMLFHPVLLRNGNTAFFNRNEAGCYIYNREHGTILFQEIVNELKEPLPVTVRLNNGSVARQSIEESGALYIYS